MRKWGYEVEYLLTNTLIKSVIALGVTGATKEFFKFMVEFVSAAHASPESAVAELKQMVAVAEQKGVRLHPFASQADREPWDQVRWRDVTSDTDYYRWVFFTAAQSPFELHHVGVHLNISDTELSGDQYIAAANWLRGLGFLFILLTANSPLRNNQPSGYLSRRAYFYPNRYDVPFWESEVEFKRWIAQQERVGRIFPGKARCWMPVAPRVTNNDLASPIDRLEIRSIDSGTNLPWETLVGCAHLAGRIIDHAASRGGAPPVTIEEMQYNDKEVARVGRRARVFYQGQRVPVRALAREWCDGIPELEDVLRHGSPAERALAQFKKGG